MSECLSEEKKGTRDEGVGTSKKGLSALGSERSEGSGRKDSGLDKSYIFELCDGAKYESVIFLRRPAFHPIN